MNFYRLHWYHVGGVLFVILSYGMGFWGNYFSQIQTILIYSFMAMLIHQFEEYAFPGGFPGIANIVMAGEKKMPDRYPLNANQVLISNVFLTYPFYIIPVFFPHLSWLGVMQIGQGILQSPFHGLFLNVKLKKFYNPGMFSCLFIQCPIGIYYLWYIRTYHLASMTDIVVGVILAFLSLFVLWLGPIALLRSRQTKYPFAQVQMYGYAQDRVKEKLHS